MREIAPFGLRMSPAMKEELIRQAKLAGRSLNQEILMRLESSLKAGPLSSVAGTGSLAAESSAAYGSEESSLDAQLLQQVVDYFYGWLDENKAQVRINRSVHGTVIVLMYRIALQSGKVSKQDMEQVLKLAA